MWICSHLLNKFLMKKFIFCALIYPSKQTENTVKKKIIYFYKNYFASLFTFFEKVFAKSLYRSVFRCKVLRPFVLYLLEVQSTVLVYSSLTFLFTLFQTKIIYIYYSFKSYYAYYTNWYHFVKVRHLPC